MNADDPYVIGIKNTKCSALFYGFSDLADLKISDLSYTIDGLNFTLSYKDEVVNAELPLLGAAQAYVVLPAIATALVQGFTLAEAVDALREFRLPPGRMNLIPGVNESLIIDISNSPCLKLSIFSTSI